MRQTMRKAWLNSSALQDTADVPDATLDYSEEAPSVLGYVPVSTAIRAFVIEPLRSQHFLISRACRQLVCDELGLLDVCAVLHDVFMGGDRGFLQSVIDSMKHQLRGNGELTKKRLDVVVCDALEVSQNPKGGSSPASGAVEFKCAFSSLTSLCGHHTCEKQVSIKCSEACSRIIERSIACVVPLRTVSDSRCIS
jgi:hypothetical protein